MTCPELFCDVLLVFALCLTQNTQFWKSALCDVTRGTAHSLVLTQCVYQQVDEAFLQRVKKHCLRYAADILIWRESFSLTSEPSSRILCGSDLSLWCFSSFETILLSYRSTTVDRFDLSSFFTSWMTSATRFAGHSRNILCLCHFLGESSQQSHPDTSRPTGHNIAPWSNPNSAVSEDVGRGRVIARLLNNSKRRVFPPISRTPQSPRNVIHGLVLLERSVWHAAQVRAYLSAYLSRAGSRATAVWRWWFPWQPELLWVLRFQEQEWNLSPSSAAPCSFFPSFPSEGHLIPTFCLADKKHAFCTKGIFSWLSVALTTAFVWDQLSYLSAESHLEKRSSAASRSAFDRLIGSSSR